MNAIPLLLAMATISPKTKPFLAPAKHEITVDFVELEARPAPHPLAHVDRRLAPFTWFVKAHPKEAMFVRKRGHLVLHRGEHRLFVAGHRKFALEYGANGLSWNELFAPPQPPLKSTYVQPGGFGTGKKLPNGAMHWEMFHFE